MEQPVGPEVVLQSLFAFLRTGVLKAAVEADLFTHIAHGNRTAEDVAAAAQTNKRATRIILDALTAMRLLTKENDRYALPSIVEMLLVKDSPSYAGAFTRIIANPRIWLAVGQLTEILRTGKPPESIVEVPEHEFWIEFSQASEQTSQLPAGFLAEMLALDPTQPLEVLDVACGSGVYGFSVLERVPRARLTSLDWQNVLQHARTVAARRGVADRVTWLHGSAFEAPLPRSHFDLVIASHFYHHFSVAENIELSTRLFNSLKPGGRLAVHEFIPDDDRAEREQPLMFAVVMLASTLRGDVYTFPEYRDMLEAAGFSDVTLHEVPMVGSHIVLASR